jgi:hypothetical protein
LYIADLYNHRIRKVTVSTGIITTYGGTGASSYSGDNGPATSAGLNYPFGVAVDSAGTHSLTSLLSSSFYLFSFYLGNIYIADQGNNRIRTVTVSTGIITTYAGTGSDSYSGDNNQATSATLNYPTGVALDSLGTYSLTRFCDIQ